MEMEVVMAVPPPPPPLPSMDFNFDSNCSSPYITAPSSPQPFGNFFFSAPTSPTRGVSSFFHNHINNNNDDLHTRHSSASEPNNNNDVNEDFEFNFSGHLERPSLSADELFHGGKIRPLKLPPTTNKTSSTKREKRLIHNEQFRETTRKRVEEGAPSTTTTSPSSISSGRKGSRRRSLSPSRVSDSDRNRSSVCDSDDVSQKGNNNNNNKGFSSSTFSFLSSISFTKGYRKWKLKDFLLFRSASEGRATDKDPLRKYMVLSKTTAHEDVRNSSFRSTESSGSVSRRRGPVSAHELHYTLNRAASEELKKKTLLPYKQGLLGCLGFNTGMHHSRRIGSMERS
ncbi:uncharacterized protein LOC133318365 [Gastrolobium bilobum]|uniref:uncharacterized protein LOC133318365 n=1 Tax=Gastrolobium bilobum TaxID=150636 RepID=UPI002AB11828|nr:uncharacterized protein LOC133318365 [Gastrolobium bilobum]